MIKRIILFGASGDLTSRLWLPAIAQIADGKLLPEGISITGSALNDWTPDEFRERMSKALSDHAGKIKPDVRQQVIDCLDYKSGDVTSKEDVRSIVGNSHEPTLVYLALPTFLLLKAIKSLGNANLGSTDAIAIEKPFGSDLESAKQLNQAIQSGLPHPSIFRIDHFLSDDLIRRILILRFANRIFEPLLNAQFVERVDISWLEELALEGRAGYYDKAGALKDMIQNHLIESLSLLLMAQPARMDEPSFRGNRVEALRSIATPSLDTIQKGTYRGRYTAGKIGDRKIPSYVDEPGVDPTKNTETYASIDLEVPSNQWHGTKFTLRSGKAMATTSAEIAIYFKKAMGYYADTSPNVLRIGLMDSYVKWGIMIKGPEEKLIHETLEMTSPSPSRTAYANLIMAMLHNRKMMFIRNDEAEESWRIIDPIAKAWENNQVPLHEYEAGTIPSR